MQCPRQLLGIALGLALLGSASAQTQGALRWRAGSNPVGLQAGSGNALVPCTSYTFSCADGASVPLYTSVTAPRSLSMQVGYDHGSPAALRAGRAPGLNLSLVGKAGLVSDFGVYGRIGTFHRSGPLLTSPAGGEGGLTYGVGLSWDFSRSASAAVGLDSYDVRGHAGEARDVRTSLGLQWRY